MCENYLNGTLEDVSKYSYLEQNSFFQIKDILNKHVDNIVTQETPLYSHKYKVAGRVDLIAEFDNILSIIDFKTSNSPKYKSIIKNYFIQETAYAMMLFEMKNIVAKQIVTIIAVDFDKPLVFIEKPQNYVEEFIKARENFKNIYGI